VGDAWGQDSLIFNALRDSRLGRRSGDMSDLDWLTNEQVAKLTPFFPKKTLYNRWKRWSDKGIFARMMAGLAAEHGEEKTVMIDATYLKAHRTATSMGVKKGGVDA
jgi:hypothetical protein